MTLERFQLKTVEAAVKRLSGDGPRRFLVADEVGLGKTVIAREIAARLRDLRQSLNLLYLCPSLQIAGQNREKLQSLTGLEADDLKGAADRMTMSVQLPARQGAGFRICTFTPDTSLPGWKPGVRTGRKEERAVLRTLLDGLPTLRNELLALDKAREGRRLLDESASNLTMTSVQFESALRSVFGCDGRPLERFILNWLDGGNDIGEFISRARAAMALAALRSPSSRPDLVILDEFHRYADLLLPQKPSKPTRKLSQQAQAQMLERAEVHRLLVDSLLSGPQRPALLLLSATPYRLRKLNGEELHPADRYQSLADLVGFLSDDNGQRSVMLRKMRSYQDALTGPGERADVFEKVQACKRALEATLRPLMARTERAIASDQDLFKREPHKVTVAPADLTLFRHFARAISGARPHLRGWAPALWTSVPYPEQTLHGYGLWKTILKAKDPPPITIGSGRKPSAHPQMRKLEELVGKRSQLVLPWQRSTLPWWKLEGPWADDGAEPSGKTLLFSRWRAAPTSVSALLSLTVIPARIRRSKGTVGKKKSADAPLLRPGGSSSGALIGLFAPWPNLSHAVEPLKSSTSTLAAVKKAAVRDLRSWLLAQGVLIEGKSKRPPWLLAISIECGIRGSSYTALINVLNSAHTGKKGPQWDKSEPLKAISPSELSSLATYVLSAPGAILARCARRHDVPQAKSTHRQELFDFTWSRLRGYFGNRAFARLILANSRHLRYPDALAEACLKGGLEAVLDEQMSVLRTIGDKKGTGLLAEMNGAILDRPGLVRLRRGTRDRPERVQAAVPFAGGEQRSARGSGKLRADTLRRAFNSPFWPHVLSTTSVGQEGLDFHVWCDRIVHWDLPTDPVDFEQREGRIARYASLSVRRSLARKFGDLALSAAEENSPFSEMLVRARGQESTTTGLETWWLPDRSKPVSVTFDWKFSVRTVKMKAMLKDLLYYRLGLGQPAPEQFVDMLKRIEASSEEARSLAIDLSAIGPFLEKKRSGSDIRPPEIVV
jgi:hypothetical protein